MERISIQASCYWVVALLLMFIPVQWILSALIAIFIHEISHILSLWFMKIPIYKIHVGLRGIEIHAGNMTNKQEFICAFAGPLGGSLLVLFSKQLPYAAICGVMQSVFNMFPVYPMDGGRMLRCLLKIFPNTRIIKPVEIIIKVCVIIGIFLSCICLLWPSFSLWFLIPGLFIFTYHAFLRNIPCNADKKRVQYF